MKTLIATSGNVLAGPDGDGGYKPLTEVVLLFSEPTYEADAGGYTKRHAVSVVRFGATPDALRKVAKQLVKMADEAEHMLDEFVVKCKADDQAAG